MLLSFHVLREGNVFSPSCHSVHEEGGGLCPGGLCPGGSLFGGWVSLRDGSLSKGISPGGLCPGGLCPGRSLTRGSLSGDLCPGGVSVRETSVRYRSGGTYPTGVHSCLKMHRDYLPHLLK